MQYGTVYLTGRCPGWTQIIAAGELTSLQLTICYQLAYNFAAAIATFNYPVYDTRYGTVFR